MTETTTLKFDRTHKFQIGDIVTPRDADGDAEVIELTVRIRSGVAYPTYTLFDPMFNEEIQDVLCTDDLVLAEAVNV